MPQKLRSHPDSLYGEVAVGICISQRPITNEIAGNRISIDGAAATGTVCQTYSTLPQQ
jgi:hypothetical protein